MSAFKGKMFPGQHQALSITVLYLLVSGIWIYVSNYLLFGQFSTIGIRTLAEIEAVSDASVVLATAVLL